MGLCIEYTLKVKDAKSIAPLMAAARAEAKRLKWKTARGSSSRAIEFLPHAECEPVRLDFADGRTSNCITKTSFAPPSAHIAICTFLRAIKQYCLSLRVSDECGYWPKFNEKSLLKARGQFDGVFKHYPEALDTAATAKVSRDKPASVKAKPAKAKLSSKISKPKAKPIVFTLGSAMLTPDGKWRRQKGTRIVIQPD